MAASRGLLRGGEQAACAAGYSYHNTGIDCSKSSGEKGCRSSSRIRAQSATPGQLRHQLRHRERGRRGLRLLYTFHDLLGHLAGRVRFPRDPDSSGQGTHQPRRRIGREGAVGKDEKGSACRLRPLHVPLPLDREDLGWEVASFLDRARFVLGHPRPHRLLLLRRQDRQGRENRAGAGRPAPGRADRYLAWDALRGAVAAEAAAPARTRGRRARAWAIVAAQLARRHARSPFAKSGASVGAGLRAELRGAVAQDQGRLAQLRDRQEEQARHAERAGRRRRVRNACAPSRRRVARGLGTQLAHRRRRRTTLRAAPRKRRPRQRPFERNRRVPRLPRPGARYRVHSVRAPGLRRGAERLHNGLERIGAEGR